MNTILIYIFETCINIVEAGLFFYLISKKIESKERYRDNLKAISVIGTVALTLIIILVNEIKINGMWGVLIFITAIVLGVITVQSMFEACITYSDIMSAGMMYVCI